MANGLVEWNMENTWEEKKERMQGFRMSVLAGSELWKMQGAMICAMICELCGGIASAHILSLSCTFYQWGQYRSGRFGFAS